MILNDIAINQKNCQQSIVLYQQFFFFIVNMAEACYFFTPPNFPPFAPLVPPVILKIFWS